MSAFLWGFLAGAAGGLTVRFLQAAGAYDAGYDDGRQRAIHDVIANDTATAFADMEGDELARWGGCYPHKEGD